MDHALGNISVVTEVDVEVIVESRLAQLISTLQLQFMNALKSTFEGTRQVRYFNSSKALKTAMFQNTFEQALGQVA